MRKTFFIHKLSGRRVGLTPKQISILGKKLLSEFVEDGKVPDEVATLNKPIEIKVEEEVPRKTVKEITAEIQTISDEELLGMLDDDRKTVVKVVKEEIERREDGNTE